MLRLLVPFLLLAALVGATVLSDRPPKPADFTFINGNGDVNTLDPQRMSWQPDLRAARMFFEGLTANDVFTWGYDIIPAVAESWEVSDDGKEYTFHLRDDAKWSNGAPVTAGDFVYSWRRAMLPDIASDYIAFFLLIEGGPEFYDWRNDALSEYEARPAAEKTAEAADALWRETLERFDSGVALKARDDHTLWMRLTEPTPYWLDLCAFAVFYPVYPPLVSAYERPSPDSGRLDLKAGWTKPDRLVSNGPFNLTKWRFKRSMRAEKNPYYWNRDAIALDTIEMPAITEPNAMVLAFQTGAVDWVTDVTVGYRADIIQKKKEFYEENREQYEALKAQGLDPIEIDRRLPKDPRKNIHVFPAFATYWYNFNCLPKLPDGRDNPFHDPRVRRAFAMAIDKQTLVDQVKRTGEPVASTIIPPHSIGGYESPKGLPYDPAAARKLLAEAGWPDPAAFPTVEIMFNKDAGHDLIAQAVAKDWQRNLGVSVSLDQKELKVYRNDLKKANYMVTRAGWYADYGDPTTFLEINRSTDGNNDRKYNNPHYDDLLDQARSERDPEKRMAILSEAERILVEEDLPLVPLYHYVTVYLFDADTLSGVNPHPRATQNVFLFDVLGDGKGPDVPRTMPALPPADADASEEHAGADGARP
ncbi:MAG: peptide ABC transporter substrate-binding protein [Phycisphaerales bacterium]